MSPSKDARVQALQTVLYEIDPLYEPASLLLGFVHLNRGEAENAIKALHPLAAKLQAEATELTSQIRVDWLQPPTRSARLFKSFLRHWSDYVQDALPFVIGGSLLISAEIWAEFESDPARMDESSRHLLATLLGDKAVVDRACGILSSTEKKAEGDTQTRARNLLTSLLDASAISEFDWSLQSLNLDVLLASISKDYEGKPKEGMKKLKKGRVAEFLSPGIKTLEELVDTREWSAAQKKIRELRRYTAEASLGHVAALLDDPSIESLGARVAGWFLPALASLRKQRGTLKKPLYIEAEYHLALAEFLSFEPTSLVDAYQRAAKLRKTRLSGPGSKRQGNLEILSLAIEIGALSRLSMLAEPPPLPNETSWNPDTELFAAGLLNKDRLTNMAKDPSGDKEVRAAADATMGLITRYERRTRKGKTRSYDVRAEANIYVEFQHYRRSLELHESSTVRCYLAESLNELGRAEEAEAQIRQALLVTPKHKLALLLAVPK